MGVHQKKTNFVSCRNEEKISWFRIKRAPSSKWVSFYQLYWQFSLFDFHKTFLVFRWFTIMLKIRGSTNFKIYFSVFWLTHKKMPFISIFEEKNQISVNKIVLNLNGRHWRAGIQELDNNSTLNRPCSQRNKFYRQNWSYCLTKYVSNFSPIK